MSWNFKMVGADREKLKYAVHSEYAPAAVKAEVCIRIDGLKVNHDEMIFVDSYGHLEVVPERPFRGLDKMVIIVMAIKLVD
jgi:hypothetical protein